MAARIQPSRCGNGVGRQELDLAVGHSHICELDLVGKGMRRTRASERLSGGLSPPKMAAALAPDACRSIDCRSGELLNASSPLFHRTDCMFVCRFGAGCQVSATPTCTKIRSAGPSCAVCSFSVLLMSAVSMACGANALDRQCSKSLWSNPQPQ